MVVVGEGVVLDPSSPTPMEHDDVVLEIPQTQIGECRGVASRATTNLRTWLR